MQQTNESRNSNKDIEKDFRVPFSFFASQRTKRTERKKKMMMNSTRKCDVAKVNNYTWRGVLTQLGRHVVVRLFRRCRNIDMSFNSHF